MAVYLNSVDRPGLATVELYTGKLKVVALLSTKNHDIDRSLCQGSLHIDGRDLFNCDITSRYACRSLILIILLYDDSIGSHAVEQNISPDDTRDRPASSIGVRLDSQAIATSIRVVT